MKILSEEIVGNKKIMHIMTDDGRTAIKQKKISEREIRNETPKPEVVEISLDLNNDGKVDKEDATIGGKVLAEVKKIKKRKVRK